MRSVHKLLSAAALFSVAALAGCGEVAGPGEQGESPRFLLASPVAGEVTLCKVGPAGFTYNFSVSQAAAEGGTLGTLVAGPSVDLAGGECALIWEKHTAAGPTADPPVTVTVIENGPPDGTSFVGIAIENELGSSVAGQTANVEANVFHGGVVEYTNELVPDEHGTEGCTPGYWKNTRLEWPIDPATDFDTYFGVDLFDPDISFWTAINLGGGGVNALARHAVAAALNAAADGVDSYYSTAEIIALVQGAAADATTTEWVKNLLATANELGCPLPNR